MFESLIIKRFNDRAELDFGLLAEALLFYDRVALIVNAGQLTTLVRVCGHETLQELFDMNVLTLKYFENGAGVRTLNTGTANEKHDFILYEMSRHRLQNALPELMRDIIGRSGKARRVAERLKRSIAPTSYSDAVNEEVLEDIQNSEYVSEAILKVVQHLAPEYEVPQPFVFDVLRDGDTLRVSTNLDFPALNRVYHLRVPPQHSTLSAGYLLSLLQEARSDLQLAASTDSELAISKADSLIIGARLEDVFRRRTRSKRSLSLFQEFAFEDARAVSEAVNSGQRNMQDVAALVAAAEKFRKWVRNQPEDRDLRKAYLSEVARLGWAERLPHKTVRWGLFTVAGTLLSTIGGPIAGTAAAVGLSALDAFVFDRIVQGWKPNEFVEGPLRQFVRSDPTDTPRP